MQGNTINAVAVPVARERDITRVAKREAVVGSTKTAAVFTQFVDDEELVRCGAEYRDRIDTVAVPVTCKRYVSGVAEVEPQVSNALSVRVPQIDAPVTRR